MAKSHLILFHQVVENDEDGIKQTALEVFLEYWFLYSWLTDHTKQ